MHHVKKDRAGDSAAPAAFTDLSVADGSGSCIIEHSSVSECARRTVCIVTAVKTILIQRQEAGWGAPEQATERCMVIHQRGRRAPPPLGRVRDGAAAGGSAPAKQTHAGAVGAQASLGRVARQGPVTSMCLPFQNFLRVLMKAKQKYGNFGTPNVLHESRWGFAHEYFAQGNTLSSYDVPEYQNTLVLARRQISAGILRFLRAVL